MSLIRCDVNAWMAQITLLQKELSKYGAGWIALEFSIPRMGKRADAIRNFEGIVFVVEFKIGEEKFTASAIDQVVDYALDLKNFHTGSHSRCIIPISPGHQGAREQTGSRLVG